MARPLGPAHLGDVDQALEPRLDLDEGAEGGEAHDLALDALAHLVLLGGGLPGVGGERLDAQVDALALTVHREHLGLDHVAHLDDFTRVLEAAPGELAAVNQAVDRAQVDEGAEVGHLDDLALHLGAGLEAFQHLGALLLLVFLEQHPAREDDPALLAVDLGDLDRDRLAHELVELGHPLDVDLRRGNEGAHALQVGHQAAAHLLAHGHLDGLALLGQLHDLAPGLVGLGALLGKDDDVIGKVDAHHVDLDLVPGFEHLLQLFLGEGFFGQLVERDDAFDLCAYVDRHPFAAHEDDPAGQHLAAAHLGAQPGLGLLERLLHRHLGRSGGFGRRRGLRSLGFGGLGRGRFRRGRLHLGLAGLSFGGLGFGGFGSGLRRGLGFLVFHPPVSSCAPPAGGRVASSPPEGAPPLAHGAWIW